MFPLQFFPNDAVDNGEQPVPENGIEWQWHSTLLEHAFPASYFIDNAGMQVTPGTCNAFYQYTDSTEKVVGHVTLSLGEVYGL